jgi:hypothetical protein
VERYLEWFDAKELYRRSPANREVRNEFAEYEHRLGRPSQTSNLVIMADALAKAARRTKVNDAPTNDHEIRSFGSGSEAENGASE